MAPEQGEASLSLRLSLLQFFQLLQLFSIDLVVVSELVHQEITADIIFSMIAPAKTPFLLVASIAITPTTPELSITTLPQQSSPSAITPPPLEVNFKDEIIEGLIEGSTKI